MSQVKTVAKVNSAVLFVGRERRVDFESWKEILETHGSAARFVPALTTLSNTLLAFHESVKITVVVATDNLSEAERIVGSSEGVEVIDHYDY